MTKRVDVRHHIMPPLLLLDGCNLKLFRIQMLLVLLVSAARSQAGAHKVRLHLLNGLIRDGEPEFLLRDGEVQPQLPPGEKAVLCR